MLEFPVETLWEAHNQRRPLWALCRNCGHVVRFDAYDLLKKVRETDKNLWHVSKLLKCSSCKLHVTVLIPAEGPGHGMGRKADRR